MPFPLALHSVSYAGVWPGQARLTLEAFLEKARALGFEAVMLMAKRPHLSLIEFDVDSRAGLKRKLDQLGLRVACLAGYTDFCLGAERPDIPMREMQVLYVHELAAAARALDCPLIRIFTAFDHPAVSYDQQWSWCVSCLRECAEHAARLGVKLAVQNHHDTAAHVDTLLDLLQEINHPACLAAFDAWSPALQGTDLALAVRRMQPYLAHTTVADYVRRPRFRYVPNLVNYTPELAAVRAVPLGEGFIDYASFFQALRSINYQGYVAYEMCSYLRGGGGEANLDTYARRFLEYMGRVKGG